MTREEMLERLLALTGVDTAEEESVLGFVLDATIDKALAFLRTDALPYRAGSLVVEMAADAFRIHKLERNEAGAVTGSVQSISDNGQSVTYRDGSEALNAVNAAFLKNYADRLTDFRKAGW